MSKQGHLTILSGPPASGKTIYTRTLSDDPEVPDFIHYEGHNEPSTIQAVLEALSGHEYAFKGQSNVYLEGIDVVYETTHTLAEISPQLLDRADTIEIFRRDPNFKEK